MEVSSAALAASLVSSPKTADPVQMVVFKKALDAQAQAAIALIEALPKPPSLPPNLGQNVNTTA